jgi:hypothetical protein
MVCAFFEVSRSAFNDWLAKSNDEGRTLLRQRGKPKGVLFH